MSLIVAVSLVPSAGAETYEVGLQLTGVHLLKIDEAPFGIGARFNYNLTQFVAADGEITHYPENPSGNFGETAALAGIRAGKRVGRIGTFIKVRPGVMHFGGEYFKLRLDERTHFIMDVGVVLEYYPSPHTFIRVDAGDTIIYFGNARLFNRPNPDALGTIHNFQPGVGFGFRF